MKRLLIRADDLGYSEGINYGIAKAVNEGIIKSVGVMTNMPSVEQGLRLIQNTSTCLGQHTNICVGHPLTNPSLISSITNEQGEFKSSSEYRNAQEDFVVLEEVILEIEAQYERFVELTGDQPHYFEGHAVASGNFFKGLQLVAERHNLKYLGMSMGEPIKFSQSQLYPHLECMKPDYDPFAELKKVIDHAHEDGCEMFICHPGYLDAYILQTSSLTLQRAYEVEMACNPETKRWLDEQQVQLVTYDDL